MEKGIDSHGVREKGKRLGWDSVALGWRRDSEARIGWMGRTKSFYSQLSAVIITITVVTRFSSYSKHWASERALYVCVVVFGSEELG